MNYQQQFQNRQRKKRDAVARGRECNGCTACCTVLGVTELDKPASAKCQHEVLCTGCAIYNSRPKSCEIYACLWRLGNLSDEELRPDKLRLIFDDVNRPNTISCDNHMINCREVWDGAADSRLGKLAIEMVSRIHPIVVIGVDQKTKRLVGETKAVTKILREAKQSK